LDAVDLVIGHFCILGVTLQVLRGVVAFRRAAYRTGNTCRVRRCSRVDARIETPRQAAQGRLQAVAAGSAARLVRRIIIAFRQVAFVFVDAHVRSIKFVQTIGTVGYLLVVIIWDTKQYGRECKRCARWWCAAGLAAKIAWTVQAEYAVAGRTGHGSTGQARTGHPKDTDKSKNAGYDT